MTRIRNADRIPDAPDTTLIYAEITDGHNLYRHLVGYLKGRIAEDRHHELLSELTHFCYRHRCVSNLLDDGRTITFSLVADSVSFAMLDGLVRKIKRVILKYCDHAVGGE